MALLVVRTGPGLEHPPASFKVMLDQFEAVVRFIDGQQKTRFVLLNSGHHRKIRSVINLKMGPQAGGNTCPIIEVALADADKVFI